MRGRAGGDSKKMRSPGLEHPPHIADSSLRYPKTGCHTAIRCLFGDRERTRKNDAAVFGSRLRGAPARRTTCRLHRAARIRLLRNIFEYDMPVMSGDLNLEELLLKQLQPNRGRCTSSAPSLGWRGLRFSVFPDTLRLGSFM